jgi:hypothetical protein
MSLLIAVQSIINRFRAEENQPVPKKSRPKSSPSISTTAVKDTDIAQKTFIVQSPTYTEQSKQESQQVDKNRYNLLTTLLEKVDLSSPPGLAGDICNDVGNFERRPLPSIRPAVALTLLALIAEKQINIQGEKVTFYSLVIALSASGKEALQRYIKAMTKALGISHSLCPEPRSDKNIMLDLLENNQVLYVLDEAHKFFGKALSKKSASFEAAIGDLLMELKTSDNFLPARSVVGEVTKSLEAELTRINSIKIKSPKKVEREKEIESKLKTIDCGIENPLVNLLSFSTPRNSAFIVNIDTIMSGFIGRLFLFSGEENRTKLKRSKSFIVAKKPSLSIIQRCKQCMGSNQQITLAKDCEKLIDLITDYFEDDSRLNHEHMGALYARGTEHVLNIASILAIETKQINSDMLCYATRMFLQNIRFCEKELSKKLKYGNDELLKSAARVAKRVTQSKGPQTIAVIANHFLKCNSQVRQEIENGNSEQHIQLIQSLVNQNKLIEADFTVNKIPRYMYKEPIK